MESVTDHLRWDEEPAPRYYRVMTQSALTLECKSFFIKVGSIHAHLGQGQFCCPGYLLSLNDKGSLEFLLGNFRGENKSWKGTEFRR